MSLSFGDIAQLVGGLPRSAHEHRAWWANTRSHPNAVAWLDAGWELVDVSFDNEQVRFRRVATPTAAAPSKHGSDTQSPQPSHPRRHDARQLRIGAVITEFGDLLDYYDEHLPFDRSGQYAYHRRTIDLRRSAGSVANALDDERFLSELYATLESWGIGSRASRLVPFSAFLTELRSWSRSLQELEDLEIDAPMLNVGTTEEHLWRLIDGIHVVENQARLVALSKTLHHVLPDLLPPIDRMYTQEFFGFHSPEFQYGQQRVFAQIWLHFVEIARAVHPAAYIGPGWRTSRSKVIDNAIVAYVHRSRQPTE